MKKTLLLLVSICCIACSTENKTVNLIFDTDMAPDYDDVGALAMLHAMADAGEVNILATVSSNTYETAVPCIDVLNTYFGRPDIPIGAVKGEEPNRTTWHTGILWTEELPKRFPHRVRSTSESEDALTLYRRLLSQQPDNSVTIVTVGFFSNLKNLLLSEGDQYSPLSGRELVAAKVKQLVSMAGIFPEGKEFNVEVDAKASQVVFSEWPTPILLSGFEIGYEILTGKRVIETQKNSNPVRDAYAICLPQDDPKGRHSWDQTATLVGVRGVRDYFDTEKGRITVYDDGSNSWQKDENGPHSRLLFKMPVDELTTIIEDLMIYQPRR